MSLQRFLPRQLDRQVILLVGLLLVIVIPLFALHEAKENADRVVDSVTRQARALAENIAVTGVRYVIVQDFVATEQLLLRSARFPGVRDIQITTPEGRLIADVSLDHAGQPQLRYELYQLVAPREVRQQVQRQKDFLIVWEPVMAADPVGWVRLTYSLAEAEKIARSYFYDYLIDGLILMGSLVVIIALVMRRSLRMLRKAAAFAGQLKDKSGAQIEVDASSVEIEQLVQALNQASASLLEQEIAIGKALQALHIQKAAMDEHSIVSITDVDGKIIYVNQKFLDATGYASDELIGKKHNIIKSDIHDSEFFRELWTAISSGRVWHGEIANRSRQGEDIWMNTTIVPFMDQSGAIYEYVAIRTDITAQKRIEQELAAKAEALRQMTNGLEDIVRQRTVELERANAELQRLNRIKSEFVSVVSHELRTPLTSIKSFAEILESDLGEIDIDTQRRFLAIIKEEGNRLGRLINDLLDLQKMDAGKMIWKDERCDLTALLRNAVEFFAPACVAKGLQLQTSLPDTSCFVELDADRIKQLITNLLSNALKFTEHGGITVSMAVEPAEIRVVVADTGVGIPAGDVGKVFESFYQIDSSVTRRVGGSGLGLAICREIVGHYRGRIWAESVPGQGSRFIFTLPLPNTNAC